MTLKVPEAPVEAFQIIHSTTKKFANRGWFRRGALNKARRSALNLAIPHPTYMLGLQSLVEGHQLEAANLTGWRYLILEGDKAIASAEAVPDAAGSVRTFSQFNEGPFVRSTIDAIAVAEELPQVVQGSYELRLLSIPALYVMALWLKDSSGNQDLLLPMAPTPNMLEPNRPYTESEFFAILQEPARQRLEFDDSPQSQSE